MPEDDPISQLVELYKHSLLVMRVYQQLAGTEWPRGVASPNIENLQQRLAPVVEAEFRVYKQSLRDGYSPKDALQALLDSFH